MKKILILLAVAGLLGAGPVLAEGGGQCSCSVSHWLTGGCSLTGPCPCNCSCGFFKCDCYCANRQFATPMVG